MERNHRCSERSRRRAASKESSRKKEKEEVDNENCEQYQLQEENEQFIPEEVNEGMESSLEVNENAGTSYQEVGIQVKSGDFLPRFFAFLKSYAELSTATGIESFTMLKCIVELASVVYNGRDDGTVKMSLHDKIVMTFVKLKQNLSYAFLAVIFNCYSAKHCSRIFEEIVVLLSSCLQVAIPWPS